MGGGARKTSGNRCGDRRKIAAQWTDVQRGSGRVHGRVPLGSVPIGARPYQQPGTRAQQAAAPVLTRIPAAGPVRVPCRSCQDVYVVPASIVEVAIVVGDLAPAGQQVSVQPVDGYARARGAGMVARVDRRGAAEHLEPRTVPPNVPVAATGDHSPHEPIVGGNIGGGGRSSATGDEQQPELVALLQARGDQGPIRGHVGLRRRRQRQPQQCAAGCQHRHRHAPDPDVAKARPPGNGAHRPGRCHGNRAARPVLPPPCRDRLQPDALHYGSPHSRRPPRRVSSWSAPPPALSRRVPSSRSSNASSSRRAPAR